MKNRVFIGTSGFTYKHWADGVFYPEGLTQRRWLEYYAGRFSTLELNVSFYRLPSETTFESWYKRTPEDFTFALKGSRFITHIKRLDNCQEPLRLFFPKGRDIKGETSFNIMAATTQISI